jgi:hypothetical protein
VTRGTRLHVLLESSVAADQLQRQRIFPDQVLCRLGTRQIQQSAASLPAGTVGLGGYDLTAAYYQYNQKSNAANGCTNAGAGTCAGELHDASLVADYHFTKRFDGYAGVNCSLVQNGLAIPFSTCAYRHA